jgi:hypothetical protein
MTLSELRRHSLIKPNLQTLFCIDFDWWKNHDTNWKVHLQSCLCEEHRKVFENPDVEEKIDWIDPETAEVYAVDGLQQILMSHCARQPEFINSYTTVVDAIFRVFLANGNTPISVEELSEKTGKPANSILQILSGRRVYKGIRPCAPG